MTPAVADLVRTLDLKPHPEGGFFSETYRSSIVIPRSLLTAAFHGPRNLSTSILYLLQEGERSRLHRLASDELWYYHLGGPLELHILHSFGAAERVVLGPDPALGHRFQVAIPAGCWFGALPVPGGGHTLAGCAMAPGFDFAEFTMGDRAALLRQFPGASSTIELLA